MNKLYNIFKNEKERNPDMTVFYREGNDKMENSLSYSNDEGKLTILFRKGGIEEFHFRKPDEKGLGDIVQTLYNKGKDGEMPHINSLFDLPKRFREIAQSYQYERKEIGIDKGHSKHDVER